MHELADQRASVARDWLLERGNVPPERLFVLEPKIEAERDDKKVGSRVEFSLK
jgi:hypothetical protein